MTADQMAMQMLIKGDHAGIKRLAIQLSNRDRGIFRCPECGSMGPHDSNGDEREPTYCCTSCGEQTDECYIDWSAK